MDGETCFTIQFDRAKVFTDLTMMVFQRDIGLGILSLLVIPVVSGLVPTTWNGKYYDCKCYYGDDC
jgi:hypothetical protein